MKHFETFHWVKIDQSGWKVGLSESVYFNNEIKKNKQDDKIPTLILPIKYERTS